MDDLDRAQAILEGRCLYCSLLDNVHLAGCPNELCEQLAFDFFDDFSYSDDTDDLRRYYDTAFLPLT